MSEPEQIPEHLLQRLQSELKGGEVVLWSGQPILGQYGKKGALLLAAIYSQALVFSLFLLFKPIKNGDIFSFSGLSGLFVLGFSVVLIFRAFGSMQRAKHIIYAITTQRALVIDGAANFRVTSYMPEKIISPSRTEKPDGTGDLVLLQEEIHSSDGTKSTVSRCFYAIRSVKNVEARLFEMLQRARA